MSAPYRLYLVDAFTRSRFAGNPAGDFRIWMTQRDAEFGSEIQGSLRGRLLMALGLHQSDIAQALPIEIVSTGHSKVIVPLRDRGRLHSIVPDLPTLAALSAEIGCNGYYPFSLSDPAPGVLSHGRMFAPAIGIAKTTLEQC
jgi:PhzF family phenazine biosynthesis protein